MDLGLYFFIGFVGSKPWVVVLLCCVVFLFFIFSLAFLIGFVCFVSV